MHSARCISKYKLFVQLSSQQIAQRLKQCYTAVVTVNVLSALRHLQMSCFSRSFNIPKGSDCGHAHAHANTHTNMQTHTHIHAHKPTHTIHTYTRNHTQTLTHIYTHTGNIFSFRSHTPLNWIEAAMCSTLTSSPHRNTHTHTLQKYKRQANW